ncbi:predicted protein [Postia placenta Mad-698-R]|uniref:F-box domain-containing protein n=1 Tax=Postia placenta MAD-698-R-SB12 TaxID=670580 RepID=A0A1X6MJD5_9APHY|nr:hypothetical protein POSPLADRAFT_1050873 [Postia placenta MAD-698-R-SB12]EED78186.1 predicted protein [Postia placenta Mad-698-R]OSX56153.1 hypothetical protein POSPLADRAFT_1050873 [Postia placenta MAD-698-R-SB12]
MARRDRPPRTTQDRVLKISHYKIPLAQIFAPLLEMEKEKEKQRSTLNLTTLNEDVLLEILEELSPLDAFNLSLTSRLLYPIARCRALSAIELRTQQQLVSFCDFMLDDIDSRLYWLRRLCVRLRHHALPESLLSPPMQRLASLLKRATGLRHLEIDCLDLAIDIEPYVGRTLEALSGLVSLKLLNVSQHSLGVLSRLQARVQRLSVHMAFGADGDSLLPTISRFTACESLSLERVFIESISSSAFPAVRELSLCGCYVPLSTLRAFSHLRVLRLEQHIRCPDPLVSSAPCWSHLDYLEAHTDFARHWRLGCPISHVSLASVMGSPARVLRARRVPSTPESVVLLRLVRDSRPIVLDFRIMVGEQLCDDFWQKMIRYMPKLRSLEIELCSFEGQDNLLTHVLWLDAMAEQLRSLRSLMYIGVCINSSIVRHNHEGTKVPMPKDCETARSLAAKLAAVMPSLKCVLFGFGSRAQDAGRYAHLFRGDFSWWKVLRVRGMSGSLVPLSPQRGEKVRALLRSPPYEEPVSINDDQLEKVNLTRCSILYP